MDYKDRAAAWLADPAIDEATKEEIRGLEADPKELEDRFYRDLEFGTAGMRGVTVAPYVPRFWLTPFT